MKIEIKRWDNDQVIHGGDFNSIKECLEDGVKKGISFYRASLNGAGLNGAILICARLNNANLNGAGLNGARLTGASLTGASLNDASLNDARLNSAGLNGASLNGAILNGARLNNANLNGAGLNGAILNGAILNGATGKTRCNRINSSQIGKYNIIMLDNETLWGGCTKKTVKEWLKYKGEDLNDYDKWYLKAVTKPFIRAVLKEKEMNK